MPLRQIKPLTKLMNANSKLIYDLRAVATGEIGHAFSGLCPDAVEGTSSRDNKCPACRVLLRADRFLAKRRMVVAPGQTVRKSTHD